MIMKILPALPILFLLSTDAMAQAPKANGETLNIQHYAGTTGNLLAVVAAKKGFCDRYNFKCELKTINSGILGLQTLVGKTIDVAHAGTEQTASTVIAGADLVIVGTSISENVLFLAARSDISTPNKAKGYPAVMADFKGLKIGVPARGSAAETFMNIMLREGGLQPSDVTYVGVGGPATAYTSMVVGKQVDAVILFEPVKTLCSHTKACSVVVDMTQGEGPKIVREMSGSGVVFVMRREFADGNPALMAAFYAALTDAAKWSRDPTNFEDLVKIFTPIIGFGDIPGADDLRRSFIKTAIPSFSPDLKVSRTGVQATINFGLEAKSLEKPIDVSRLVWDKAP